MNRTHVTIALLGLTLLVAGCKKAADPVWTAESSAAFRAAWEKRRAGDDKAADAMLAALAKKHADTRAGRRAGDPRQVDLSSMSSLSSLLQALSKTLAPALPEPDGAGDDVLPDVPDEPALVPGEPAPGGP